MSAGRARTRFERGLPAAFTALVLLCLFVSCASTGDAPDFPAGDPPSDAALLDDSSQVASTEVSDSEVFSDLQAEPESEATEAPAAEEDPFYRSIGGETLGRLALTLYSDRSFTKSILEKNPGLKGVAKLNADQRVFFDMGSVRPEPIYLTKDLLARYPDALAARLNQAVAEKGLLKTSVTVEKGETLQDVSRRLYGTSRYWTEIYLVNHDKISNYDQVKAGMTLTVLNRSVNGMAKTQDSGSSVPGNVAASEGNPAPLASPSAVIPAESEPVAMADVPTKAPPPEDPIPETPPPVAEVKVEPSTPPLSSMDPPKTALSSPDPGSVSSSSANLRRALYAALVLLIGTLAFYFTRTPKRPTMDMLDSTADATARPKLSPKDTQKHHIG